MSLVIPNFSSRCSMRLRYSITILHHSQTIDMFPSMYFHVHESAHENEVHISKGWWKCILNFTWDGFCLFGKKLMGDGNTFLKQSSDIMNILTHMTAFSSWLPWLYNPSTIDYHKTDVTLLTFIHEMNTKVIFTQKFSEFLFHRLRFDLAHFDSYAILLCLFLVWLQIIHTIIGNWPLTFHLVPSSGLRSPFFSNTLVYDHIPAKLVNSSTKLMKEYFLGLFYFEFVCRLHTMLKLLPGKSYSIALWETPSNLNGNITAWKTVTKSVKYSWF